MTTSEKLEHQPSSSTRLFVAFLAARLAYGYRFWAVRCASLRVFGTCRRNIDLFGRHGRMDWEWIGTAERRWLSLPRSSLADWPIIFRGNPRG